MTRGDRGRILTTHDRARLEVVPRDVRDAVRRNQSRVSRQRRAWDAGSVFVPASDESERMARRMMGGVVPFPCLINKRWLSRSGGGGVEDGKVGAARTAVVLSCIPKQSSLHVQAAGGIYGIGIVLPGGRVAEGARSAGCPIWRRANARLGRRARPADRMPVVGGGIGGD